MGKAAQRKQQARAMTMARGKDQQVTLPAVMSKVMQSDFEIMKGSRRGSLRIKGQDWLGRLPIGGAPAAGSVLGEFYINPLEYPGTRLALFAQLYDKFRFLILRFKFVPYQGTSVPGAIIIAYDRDISDPTPAPNDNGVRQLLSMQDAVSGPIWQPLTATCPLSHPEEGLFTNPVPGGDERLAYQGQVYLALLEPPAAGVVLAGDLFVEYDVEFFDPQLETSVSVGAATVNGANKIQFGTSNNDVLYSFLPTINPTSNQTQSPAYIPKQDSNGKSYLDLAQGVYRVWDSLTQTKAGSVDLGLFTQANLVPNVTKPSPAPQPMSTLVDHVISTAIGAVASSSGLFAVPPGGARWYNAAADLSGVDATSAASALNLRVDKIADAWSDLTNFL